MSAVKLLQTGKKFVTYCEPCGDKQTSAIQTIKRVDLQVPQPGYFKLSVNGKSVDLAYLFIQQGGQHNYVNVGLQSGCRASDVSSSLQLNTAKKKSKDSAAVLRAKRVEILSNVHALRQAQLAYEASEDRFVVNVPPHPRALSSLNSSPVKWTGSYGFNRLSWQPDGRVRGTYWIEPHATEGFVVYGAIDADGDGIPAMVSATATRGVTLMTGEHIY